LDEKNRALDSGMNDFLTKPFSPKQLKAQLGKWLNIEMENLPTESYDQYSREEEVSIDLSYLNEMTRGDKIFAKDMIKIFLQELPIAMNRLDKALENKDWKKIGAIAHRIKVNFMMVGMKAQRENSLDIEKSIKMNKYSKKEIILKLQRLKNDSKMAYPLLEKELNQFALL